MTELASPDEGVTPSSRSDVGGLSPAAVEFYGAAWDSARAGCLNHLRKWGCRDSDAEEIFAGVFARIMETTDPIERNFSQGQIVNFLKVACGRRLIDLRQRRKVIREVDLVLADDVPDILRGPAELAEERQAIEIGKEALLALPRRYQLVFRLRHQMNLSPEEIQSNVPGLTPRSYRKIIERANARVLAAYERIDSGERCLEMEDGLLRRHLSGLADDGEEEAVRAHLEHCRSCQLSVGKMRGHLHDVASSLAVLASVGGIAARSGGGELFSQMQGSFADGIHTLAHVSGWVRERTRDLIWRLPGSGGGSPIGQVAGVSGLKVGSVCAGVAAAATCAAVGVVPGVGGLDLAVHHRVPSQPQHVIQKKPTIESATTVKEAPPSPRQSAPDRSASLRLKSIATSRKVNRSQTERTAESSPERATVSGSQTGTELGFEGPPPSAPDPPAAPPPPSSPSAESGSSGPPPSQSTGPAGSEFGL